MEVFRKYLWFLLRERQYDAEALADLVASHGGILGAAVCCAERGGEPADDWTTCEEDRDELLDR